MPNPLLEKEVEALLDIARNFYVQGATGGDISQEVARDDFTQALERVYLKGKRDSREELATAVEQGFQIDPKPPGSPMYSRGRRDSAKIIRAYAFPNQTQP